jgi:predicted tellurium resistance membrane protein TerC
MAIEGKRKTIQYLLVFVLAYISFYLVFRGTNQELWALDNQSYVIFPEGIGKLLYYFWRPLTYLDSVLTGMQFHIGPHR